MGLIDVIGDYLKSVGYRQNPDDPAYWISPDIDAWPDKLMPTIREVLEREHDG